MSTQDDKFFDLFILVIGTLIGITIALIFLARYIASGTQLQWVQSEPEYTAAVDQRLTPAGRVALPGDEGPGEAAPAVAAAAPTAASLTGEQVYNQACFACHGPGVGGAPKLGDVAGWAPRIRQGKATLNKHAIEGYQGTAGYMPPKGGRVDLSDDEIAGAVAFMAGKSGG